MHSIFKPFSWSVWLCVCLVFCCKIVVRWDLWAVKTLYVFYEHCHIYGHWTTCIICGTFTVIVNDILLMASIIPLSKKQLVLLWFAYLCFATHVCVAIFWNSIFWNCDEQKCMYVQACIYLLSRNAAAHNSKMAKARIYILLHKMLQIQLPAFIEASLLLACTIYM